MTTTAHAPRHTARPTDLRLRHLTDNLLTVQATQNGGLVTYVVDTSTVTRAPSADVPTPEVWAVVALIQDQFPGIDLFLADHHHGDVQTEGSWSIAHEGHYDWPIEFTANAREPRLVPATVHVEPIAGWCLGVYPA